MLTEDELAVKEMVSKMANEVIAPHVKEMDEKSDMFPEVIDALFQSGVIKTISALQIIIIQFNWGWLKGPSLVTS